MPRLRVLSGSDLVQIFSQFGFVRVGQKGSHVKLKRMSPQGEGQTLIVPMHSELDRGTLESSIRRAATWLLMSLRSISSAISAFYQAFLYFRLVPS